MPARVLLVDDEVSVLNALRRALHNEGYEIHVAGSGPEALDMLAKMEVAAIVCDQQMPGMTGIEVLAGPSGFSRMRCGLP